MEGGTAEQLHTEAGGRPQLTVVDDRLQLHGRTVGALHGDTLTIGRASYRISVTLNQEAIPHPERREGRWLVEVRRDAQSVAHGRAMAMCLGGLQLPGDDVQVLEIRRRVTFYLAWRELLALGQPGKKLTASGRLAPN